MRYLAPGEIFKNMLQLKRFGLYFAGILNRKWLLSYRINDISYKNAKGMLGLMRFYHVWHENSIWSLVEDHTRLFLAPTTKF